MTFQEDETKRKEQKPFVTLEQATNLLTKYYHFQSIARIKQLESYDDCNFWVTLTDGREFTLKIHNGVESDTPSVLAAQDAIMFHLSQSDQVTCPRPVSPVDSDSTILVVEFPIKGSSSSETRQFAVRVLTWVKGVTMNSIQPTASLIAEAGVYLGHIVGALSTFDHPGAHRDHQWDLAHVGSITSYLDALRTPQQRKWVEGVLEEFQEHVQPLFKTLRHGVLQADFNDANVVLNGNEADGYKVAGVIDFGDIVYSARINDIAIAVAYMLLTKVGLENPLETACAFIQGVHSVFPLQVQEIKVLYTLICCRLVISGTIGAYSMLQEPDNEYLLIHAKPAWQTIEYLRSQDRINVTNMFLKALGMNTDS